jgi:hypothetical protein
MVFLCATIWHRAQEFFSELGGMFKVTGHIACVSCTWRMSLTRKSRNAVPGTYLAPPCWWHQHLLSTVSSFPRPPFLEKALKIWSYIEHPIKAKKQKYFYNYRYQYRAIVKNINDLLYPSRQRCPLAPQLDKQLLTRETTAPVYATALRPATA